MMFNGNNRIILLISLSLVIARTLASVLAPSENITAVKAGFSLEDTVPISFSGWSVDHSVGVITPNEEGSLKDKVYDQSISRGYRNKNGYLIMLVIAYGRNQSDTLQLHRPEVCYVANGFRIISNDQENVYIKSPTDILIPSRRLFTRSSFRPEAVTYWTRVGDSLPTSNLSRQYEKLKLGLSGRVPDGVLVRVSSISEKPQEAYIIHDKFINDLLESIKPKELEFFIGGLSKKTKSSQ